MTARNGQRQHSFHGVPSSQPPRPSPPLPLPWRCVASDGGILPMGSPRARGDQIREAVAVEEAEVEAEVELQQFGGGEGRWEGSTASCSGL
uniref:DUF834 domain-containing protein n=1 Tax=Oryza punctata TaxID=4537 RepID=A0A0E0LII7_ORYPU